MNCKELEQLLSEGVLAELTPAQREAVAAHVSECAACREKWGLDQQSQDLHDAATPLRSTNTIKDAVMARIRGGDDTPSGWPQAKAGLRQKNWPGTPSTW